MWYPEASLDWCSISVTLTFVVYRASFTELKQFSIFFFHLAPRLGYQVRLRLSRRSRRACQTFSQVLVLPALTVCL